LLPGRPGDQSIDRSVILTDMMEMSNARSKWKRSRCSRME
jgi:hypothetical protein